MHDPLAALPHDPSELLDSAYRAPEADAAPIAPDTAKLESADPLKRMAAWLLDLFIIAVVGVGGVVLLVALLNASLSPAIELAAGLVLVLLVTTPNGVLMALRGQTPGKMLLRLRVVKIDGRPCGFVRGVVLRLWVPWMILSSVSGLIDRWLETTAPGTLLVVAFLAGESLLLFSREGRGVADRLAGTRVVAMRVRFAG